MSKFDKWLNRKIDELEEQYQEYVEELEANDIVTPMPFDEFAMDKYEEYLSDLEDMAYENYREGL